MFGVLQSCGDRVLSDVYYRIFNKFRVCFLVASATREACVPCLVGSRSSELTAHYKYDLATGLVGSYRSYLSGRIRSLCQIE